MPKYQSRSFVQDRSNHGHDRHYDHDFERRRQRRSMVQEGEYKNKNGYYRSQHYQYHPGGGRQPTNIRRHQPYSLSASPISSSSSSTSSLSSRKPSPSASLSRHHYYDTTSSHYPPYYQHHQRYYDYQNSTHDQWKMMPSYLTTHDCPTRHNDNNRYKLRSSKNSRFFSPFIFSNNNNNNNNHWNSRRSYMTNNESSIPPSHYNDGHDRGGRGRGWGGRGSRGSRGGGRGRGRGRGRGGFNPSFHHYQHHRHLPPKSYVPTPRQVKEWESFNSKERERPSVPTQEPSEAYMTLSEKPSEVLKEPVDNKKLIILDLNGTLASRTQNRQSMYVRPYQDIFLDYIFKHFKVMVWSSAQPHSVTNMCQLFGDYEKDLLRAWDRRYFSLTPAEYNRKSITLKDLEVIWDNLDEEDGTFDATNTILVDDSPAKAILQPYNSIHLCEFSHTSPTFLHYGESELLHVVRYLEELRFQSNVCHFMKKKPFKSVDPAKNQDKENEFKAYHYIFDQEGRRLHDFHPDTLIKSKKEKYDKEEGHRHHYRFDEEGEKYKDKHKHKKEDGEKNEKGKKTKDEKKDTGSSSSGEKHKHKKKEEDVSEIEHQLKSTKL
ncbi:hypothetical protein BDA99DRAFT_496274 [Phascolomyces articulosus]|uniref:FCP1 homology domain-containing protein n=1 Tax=Phascolomyces articulosus TaxID=60185 RepID=A0AAD5K9K4_9FUNG|nr:hypothetical protein BDA99DRAFT_496274 [Phascolomyces articulosus]